MGDRLPQWGFGLIRVSPLAAKRHDDAQAGRRCASSRNRPGRVSINTTTVYSHLVSPGQRVELAGYLEAPAPEEKTRPRGEVQNTPGPDSPQPGRVATTSEPD
jgi:hypothetical protein